MPRRARRQRNARRAVKDVLLSRARYNSSFPFCQGEIPKGALFRQERQIKGGLSRCRRCVAWFASVLARCLLLPLSSGSSHPPDEIRRIGGAHPCCSLSFFLARLAFDWLALAAPLRWSLLDGQLTHPAKHEQHSRLPHSCVLARVLWICLLVPPSSDGQIPRGQEPTRQWGEGHYQKCCKKTCDARFHARTVRITGGYVRVGSRISIVGLQAACGRRTNRCCIRTAHCPRRSNSNGKPSQKRRKRRHWHVCHTIGRRRSAWAATMHCCCLTMQSLSLR